MTWLDDIELIIMIVIININITTVEPVYYGHLGTNQKCQGVLIFQVGLCEKAPFGTITKYVDYTSVLIFKCPD